MVNIIKYTGDKVAAQSGPVISQLLESFLACQDVKPSSRDLYRRTLKQYFNWVDREGKQLREIARPDILEYKQALLSGGLSTLTAGSYLTAVRRFYEWAEAQKYYPNVAKGVKTPKRYKGFKKDPLSIDQVKQLLRSVATTTPQGKRDFAILNLLLRTGLRTVEVARANVEDIRNKAGETVLHIQGKGETDREKYVLLTAKAYQPILNYLEAVRLPKMSEPLFSSTSNNSLGGRLTTRTISGIAKKYLRGIGLNSGRLTAHSLRHTAGVNVIRAGGDLYTAQLFMRHEDPATTQLYLRTVEEELRLKNAPEKLLDAMF